MTLAIAKKIEAALKKAVTKDDILQPNIFDRKRIETALLDRERYRYVSPIVEIFDDGYLITAPCCSRNIDSQGGIIDIARLQYKSGPRPWRLFRRDHGKRQWALSGCYAELGSLLDFLNRDPQREFWQ